MAGGGRSVDGPVSFGRCNKCLKGVREFFF